MIWVRRHPPHQCRPAGDRTQATNSSVGPADAAGTPARAQDVIAEALDPSVKDQRFRPLAPHPSVPGGERATDRAASGSVGAGMSSSAGKTSLREGAVRVGLHAREIARREPVRAREHRPDAPRAPVAEPVPAEKHREVGWRDALVRVHQPAALGGNAMRQGLAGRPADPVMRPVRPAYRRRPVTRAADRHAAGDPEGDAPLVGHQQVLQRER